MFTDDKGSSLIMVLIIMGVLTIFGAAFLHYSLTDNLQVINDEKRMQAHYLARSGAEAVADYIINNPQEAAELLGKKSEKHDLGQGFFEVEVKSTTGGILIESTGNVDDFTRTVKLTLHPCSPFDAALFGLDRVSIDNPPDEIIGDICTNSIFDNSISLHHNALDKIKGIIKVGPGPGVEPSNVIDIKHGSLDKIETGNMDRIIDYPVPLFPDFPILEDKVITSGYILSDGYYNNIEVDKTLVIDIGNAGEERNIRVGNLKVKGNIVLEGEGKLNLYVDHSLDIKGDINKGGRVEALMVYYKGQETKIDGEFYGSIFALSDIRFSGNVIMVGNIISSGNIEVSCTGNSYIKGNIYAPNTTIEFKGNTDIIGSVVAKEIEFGGNGKIEYNNDILFPYLPDEGFDLQNRFRIGVWSD